MQATPFQLNIQLLHVADRTTFITDLIQRKYPDGLEWLQTKNVQVISTKTIDALIIEEQVHENKSILECCGQRLSTMSSGERKRAYFQYILSLTPEVIVLDHFFDTIDTEATQQLQHEIQQISAHTSIINLYTRPTDALAFINTILLYDNGELNQQSPENLTSTPSVPFQNLPLPKPCSSPEFAVGALVEFKNVNVSYQDNVILTNINWTINKGDFWHLRGANGSGKTTLLTMIVGDNPKAYGQDITIFGQKKGSGESIWDIKRKVGYFTSNMTFQFWRFQSITNMIISGFYDSIGLYKHPTDYQLSLANQWLTFLGLTHLANQPFIKMSACHQRMIMIARAMVKHPPLLILDEPTVDLDDESAQLIIHLINQLYKQSHTTVIYVSHRAEEGLYPTDVFELKRS